MRSQMLLLLAVSSLFLAACNTIEGMGEDIRSAGEAISDSSSSTKRKLSR